MQFMPDSMGMAAVSVGHAAAGFGGTVAGQPTGWW